MNRLSPLFAVLSLALLATSARALELPRPSPNAKLTQTVGLTDLTVEYSSPSVHGRAIFGGLLPWGEVWRAGANATTKLTFSRDVVIGGKTLAAGPYAFFVIPQKSGAWTLIINKDFEQGGSSKYNKDLDLVRVDAAPAAIPSRERLAYVFSNFDNQGGTLDLEWEKVRVSLPFQVGTDAQVEAGIQAGDAASWEFFNQAAGYKLGKKEYDAALAFADKSVKQHEVWQNVWIKAQIEAGKGNYKSAVASAEKARTLGGKDAPKFFQDESAKSIAEWKTHH